MVHRARVIDILTNELKLLGPILNFINNFLKERLMQVRVINFLSNPRTINNGLPQGSVISVLLFLIAVNEVVKCISDPSHAHLFADDLPC
ncbi:Protein of unknown function [Cotesia congregata]|uniref:Reverse transcriptase domain-containing protein n=1 Tax=Cotesia congregata TaxID=51543 RepID=A0A8J2MNH8_COTCN|nr:Protein of unknown function [Cotesia congregata]